MVRFTVYTLEFDSDSAMSAELSRVAHELSEGGRYAVELLNMTTLPAADAVLVTFEVFELPEPEALGGESDNHNGSTH